MVYLSLCSVDPLTNGLSLDLSNKSTLDDGAILSLTEEQSSIASPVTIPLHVDIDGNESLILPPSHGDYVQLSAESLEPRTSHRIKVTLLDSSSTIQLKGIWLSRGGTIHRHVNNGFISHTGRSNKTITVRENQGSDIFTRRIIEILDDSRPSFLSPTNASQNQNLAAAGSATWQHIIGDVLGADTVNFLPCQEIGDWIGSNVTNNKIDVSQIYFRR